MARDSDAVGAPSAETEKLSELLRQGERLIEAQLSLAMRAEDKAQRLLALATAVVSGAGAVALVTLGAGTGNRSEGPWELAPFLAALALGLLAATVAVLHLIDAYTGWREQRALALGSSPGALLDLADDPGAGREEVLRRTIASIPEWAAQNEEARRGMSDSQGLGLRWLAASGALLGAAFLYLLGTMVV